MRTLHPGLAAHLASGVTTLCRCWKLTRRDNSVSGFTDHDVKLSFGGTDYESAAGFTASEIPSNLGLNIDTAEITGALVSPQLSADDINAGLYDGAMIETFLVNWTDVAQRELLETGLLGEVTRQGQSFTAEVRGLASRLDQERGRLFQATGDADLGDARCGVDLNAPGNSASGEIDAVLGTRTFRVSGMSSIAEGRLARGQLTFTSGDNAGLKFAIRADRQTEEGRVIELWRAPEKSVTEGAEFTAHLGCDKTFGACCALFNNAANFRGFPHIPGSDFALSYVSRDAGDNDGSALL